MDGAARRKGGRVGRARKGIGQPSSARRGLPSDARRPVKRRMRSWQTSTWKDRKECVSRRERISDIKFSSSLLSPFPLPLPPSNTITSRTNPSSLLLLFDPRNSGEKGKPRNNNFPRFRRKERIVVGDESDEFLLSFLLDVLLLERESGETRYRRGWRGWSQFR